jgi:hypothetical protein
MARRRRWTLVTVGLWATLAWGCQPTSTPLGHLPLLPTVERPAETGQPGVLYTVYTLQLAHTEHGVVEDLWKYVDEHAPQGASVELRRWNNLRIGLIKDQFRAAAEATVARVHTGRLSPIPTFCPVGRVQFFACGAAHQDVALFLWSVENEVWEAWGRSFVQLSLAMEVAATPVRENLAELVVTPTLVAEPGERHRFQPLQTVVRAPVGASLVVGPVDPGGEALGRLFQASVNGPDDREQLLIITVDAVRLAATSPPGASQR